MFMKRPLIETERLQNIPLTHGQLINYLQTDGSLEKQLNVKQNKRKISPALIKAFEKSSFLL